MDITVSVLEIPWKKKHLNLNNGSQAVIQKSIILLRNM